MNTPAKNEAELLRENAELRARLEESEEILRAIRAGEADALVMSRQVLRHSEQGLAEAQRIAHLGSWELDLADNKLTWSDEIYRLFEIDPEKFGASYEAFLNAIHPEDRGMVNKAYTDSVKDKTPYDIVHRLQMPDGRIKYVNEKCKTYYNNDGKPLRSIGTVQDITERKEAEIALRTREEEFRTLAEAIPQIVWMTRPDGWNIYFNKQWVDYTGLDLMA